MNLGELAFRIGRAAGKHPLTGRLFCIFERLLPLNRIARTEDLVALRHPKPISDHHILIVPTFPISSLTSSPSTNTSIHKLVMAIAKLAKEVANQTDSESRWQIIINGGIRQEIGQLHGHLLKDDSVGQHAGLLLHDPENWQVLESQLRNATLDPDNGYSLIIQGVEGSRPRAHISLTTSNV